MDSNCGALESSIWRSPSAHQGVVDVLCKVHSTVCTRAGFA